MKLLIGIAPLLAIVVGLGLWAIVMFLRLGGNIDVILRENYQSVLAAQNMKEALERMDSSLLFAIGGEEARGREQLVESRLLFDKNYDAERGNITIHPREDQLVSELATLREKYMKLTERFFEAKPADRTRLYFAEALPTFNRIKDRADDVLNLNQRNMEDMDHQARSAATRSIRWMVLALIGSAAVATLIAALLSRSLLVPIRSVTRAARSMAAGGPSRSRSWRSPRTTSLASWPPRSTRWPGRSANSTRRGPRVSCGRRRRRKRRSTRSPTLSSWWTPPARLSARTRRPAACSGPRPSRARPYPGCLRPRSRRALADVLGGEHDFLPSGFEHAICLRDDGRERFTAPSRPGDPRRDGQPPRRGGRAHRRHPVPYARSAQERHGLDRQPRVEDAADEHPDGRSSPAGRGRRPAPAEAGRAAHGGPAGLRPPARDGQRPPRPDAHRAGPREAGPSARPCAGRPRGRGRSSSSADSPRFRRHARRRRGLRPAAGARWIASGSPTSSTT